MFKTIIELQKFLNSSQGGGHNLSVDGIYGKQTQAAYTNYLKKHPTQKRLFTTNQIKQQESTYNKEDNQNIINNYHQRNPTGKPYIIDNKQNNTVEVYVDGIKIREYKAIHGKNSNSTNAFYNKKVKGSTSYTVQQGDILGFIAKNNKISLKDLITLNNIKNPNLIKPGQVLKLP